MKVRFNPMLGAVGLAVYATVTFASSVYVGQIKLVEQYAPGVGSASATCFVGVTPAQVSTKPACASVGKYYYYAWECDDPRRKNFLALANTAYISEKKVMLQGNGSCSPHPQYEGLDYFIISEDP